MKKRILVVTTLLLAACGANAQQDLALTHFIYNKMAVNPGETGIENGACGSMIYRNQWDKVNGAPNSLLINAEGNLPSLLRLSPLNAGIGLNVVHDAIGFNRQTNVMLNYSQHISLNTGGTLGIGVGLGLFSFGLNPVWVPPNTLSDASLPAGSSAMTFDANFGLFYKQNNWYAGLSSTHLAAPILEQKSILGTGNVEYNGARHYYFMGGYTIDNVGQAGKVDIQMMGQTDAVKTSINLNARYIYRNFLYGGLAFRNSDAVSVLLGWSPSLSPTKSGAAQNFWVGYSYDLTIGKIASISNGTHEIAVKYCYIPKMKVTKHKHPRWL